MILLSLLILSFAAAYFVQESGQSKSDDVIISTYQIEGVPSEMINKYIEFLFSFIIAMITTVFPM